AGRRGRRAAGGVAAPAVRDATGARRVLAHASGGVGRSGARRSARPALCAELGADARFPVAPASAGTHAVGPRTQARMGSAALKHRNRLEGRVVDRRRKRCAAGWMLLAAAAAAPARAELPSGWSVHSFAGRIRDIETSGGVLACATDGGLLFFDPR